MWPFSNPKPVFPDWWQAYLQATDRKALMRQKVEEAEYLVLDTETTGLNPQKDRILSLAVYTIREGGLWMQESHSLYWSQKTAGGKAVEIHGIMPKYSESDGTDEAEAIRLFSQWAKGKIWVGHHIGFDFQILNSSLKRQLGKAEWVNPLFDTLHLHRIIRRMTAQNPISLDELCHQYRIPIEERHTAQGDAMMTALIFLKMLPKLQGFRILDLAM